MKIGRKRNAGGIYCAFGLACLTDGQFRMPFMRATALILSQVDRKA